VNFELGSKSSERQMSASLFQSRPPECLEAGVRNLSLRIAVGYDYLGRL
jgi:hypothetical protein